MKDYYDILGVPKDADTGQIKSAFRRLAFEHHPDKNPGNEQQSSERFKSINEAYSVIGDEAKRRQYDTFRSAPFGGAAHSQHFQGAYANQEEIFRQAFANGTLFDELNRSFAQSGLRFDAEFLNRMFFSGQDVHVRFYGQGGDSGQRRRSAGASSWRAGPQADNTPRQKIKKPNFIQRLHLKIQRKILGFLFKRAFGIDLNPPVDNGKTGTRKQG